MTEYEYDRGPLQQAQLSSVVHYMPLPTAMHMLNGEYLSGVRTGAFIL